MRLTGLVHTDLSRSAAVDLDRADPLAAYRDRFVVADPDLIYLDGNSLGRLPADTPALLDRVVREDWGRGLIRSWDHWLDWGTRIGDRIGEHLLGVRPGEVALSDSTSVNAYKLASAVLDAAPERRVVVSDTQEFPTNRYLLQGLADQRGLELRMVPGDLDTGLSLDAVRAALDTDVSLVLLSAVNYRSGAILDIAAVTAAATEVGARVLWDVSHAVGALPLDLGGAGAELAIGCTYKYLNGGPGSPAFLYVRTDLQEELHQPLWGWLGHRDPFAMSSTFEPGAGIRRFMVGTPPILSLACVEPAVDLVVEAGIGALREKSLLIGALVVDLADAWLTEHGVALASPRDATHRGGHVSLAVPQAQQVWRTLAEEHGVVCDVRDPDRLRIAPAPLYTRFAEVWDAMDRLRQVVAAEH